MPAGDRPSYEDLAAENGRLWSMVEALRAEVAQLRAQLGQNSKNSSRPPSSDSPFVKPAPRSLRSKSGRKPGGQPGRKGSTLQQVSDPDEVVRHEPGGCGRCGTDLGSAAQTAVATRQVFDLPPMTIRVTEHQIVTRRCECGATTSGQAPDGVNAPTQYGPRVAAIILYLYVGQFLSKQRTAQALAELFGTPVSAGTVAAVANRAADGLGAFTQTVRKRIADSPVAGFDETGLRVDGRLAWVHCARTGKYTLITCHRKRGKEGIDHCGVLPTFAGVAVHDAWAPYDTYTPAAHQLCCAHALRELQAVTDTSDDQWCWANQAADALVAMQNLVNDAITAGHNTADADAMNTQISLFQSATQIGMTETAARSSPIMKKHHALAKRLLNRQDDYLRFTHDQRVPPDNNGSERDIRMIKLRQKVSGCLRTLTGAQQFCTIRNHLSTAAKHGHSAYDILVALTKGKPWIPAT